VKRAELKETLVGALTIALLFVGVYSLNGQTHHKNDSQMSFLVSATFDRIDGVVEQSEVRMSGVRIGTVIGRSLDADYRVVVDMAIDKGVEIPIDTAAAIHTDGIFGGKFIELEPGGDFDYMADGDEFDLAQSSVVIEDLLDLIIAQGKARQAANAQ